MVEASLDKLFGKLNSELTGGGYPFKLAFAPTEALDLLDENARYMTNEQFRNLVDNVKRDGALASVPFCWKDGERYLVLSGNHRVMSAREAGLDRVLILYTDKPLEKQERIAIQISHNAIAGQDDPVILKKLWEQIDDLGLKYYAGLDDKVLQDLEKVTLDPISEVNLEFRSIGFLFLPDEAERLDGVFKRALDEVVEKDLRIARFEEFDRLIAALSKAGDANNVKNSATAIMLILDIFEAHQDDLAAGWEHTENKHHCWVPLASIFGTDRVPVDAAKVIKQAVDRMFDSGDLEKKSAWKAIELWAADSLAGA